MPTRTVVFSSQKGGSGKTTLCGQLAVQAELSGLGPVALIDTDPQGSLSDWWNSRGAQSPMFVQTTVERLYETLEELRQIGIKLIFIDTQPTVTDTIREIIRYADMVVIPTRPSPHDLRAVGPTVDLVEQCNKPMVFAINCATRRAKLTGDVAVALSQHGTVAPVTVHNRIDFATSMINGKSVMELNPESKSAEEIQSLWGYLAERLHRLERDEGYQTYQTTVENPQIVSRETICDKNPTENQMESSQFKVRNARESDPQPTGFGRRQVSTFGRRKSDDFGLDSAEADHI
ncbi:MAG: ParA family protein [Rhodospirillales bacterium]|nr:ParA family protein [Rhodospirillales bacterium]